MQDEHRCLMLQVPEGNNEGSAVSAETMMKNLSQKRLENWDFQKNHSWLIKNEVKGWARVDTESDIGDTAEV